MRLEDPIIQEAIKQGKMIKRRAWGHGEAVKDIKHAHVPSREPDKFKQDNIDIDDWEVAE